MIQAYSCQPFIIVTFGLRAASSAVKKKWSGQWGSAIWWCMNMESWILKLFFGCAMRTWVIWRNSPECSLTVSVDLLTNADHRLGVAFEKTEPIIQDTTPRTIHVYPRGICFAE